MGPRWGERISSVVSISHEIWTGDDDRWCPTGEYYGRKRIGTDEGAADAVELFKRQGRTEKRDKTENFNRGDVI